MALKIVFNPFAGFDFINDPASIPSPIPLVVADGGSLIVQDNTQVAPTEDIYFAGSSTLLMKGTGIIRFVNH